MFGVRSFTAWEQSLADCAGNMSDVKYFFAVGCADENNSAIREMVSVYVDATADVVVRLSDGPDKPGKSNVPWQCCEGRERGTRRLCGR